MGSGTEQKRSEILSPALSHPSPHCGCHRTHVPALALSWDVSQLCHHVPRGGMESCHSPTLRWERAGGERGAQGTGAGDGRDVGCGGVIAGGPKGRGGAGGTAWACPFKRRCLLSSFGTQPLSCLRLQRRRIKGLFHLNETLSPTSRGAASPTASSSPRLPCSGCSDPALASALRHPGMSQRPGSPRWGQRVTAWCRRVRGRGRAQPRPHVPTLLGRG